MSKTLNVPLASQSLDRIRIASIKVEHNRRRGQEWVEFWLTYGRLLDPEDEDSFVEYADPASGAEAVYLKMETGANPFGGTSPLGRCGTCGKWFPIIGGDCDVEGCTGQVAPYDGWARLCSTLTADGANIMEALRDASYAFLCAEAVPHPDNWELDYLIDAS